MTNSILFTFTNLTSCFRKELINATIDFDNGIYGDIVPELYDDITHVIIDGTIRYDFIILAWGSFIAFDNFNIT